MSEKFGTHKLIEATKKRWDIIDSAKLDMAGVEGILEDMGRGNNFTVAELRSCMVRMAQTLHETRMKINEAIALPHN